MSISSSRNDSQNDSYVRSVATGAVFLVGSFVLWFGLLAVDLISSFFQYGRHLHQHGYHAFSLFTLWWSVICIYPAVFFVVAFVIGNSRWSFRPAIVAPIAYAIYLAAYLPSLDWTRKPMAGELFENTGLALPLITSAVGALLGERLAIKRQRTRLSSFGKRQTGL